jgi:LAGLIDADG DNA endonuclease family protein
MSWEAQNAHEFKSHRARSNWSRYSKRASCSVLYPRLDDIDLAYETGFHIGDGSLGCYSNHQYRYALSGNKTTETGFYRFLIAPLLKRLYGLTPSMPIYGNSIYAIIYSKSLVYFKSEVIGLPVGPKDSLSHLPPRILCQGTKNRAKLISGLYDADGCVKTRKTISGIYPRISIAQKNKGIVDDLHKVLLQEFDISSTLYRNDYDDARVSKVETRWFLDINGYENLWKYANLIGSRHPVIRKRIGLFLGS